MGVKQSQKPPIYVCIYIYIYIWWNQGMFFNCVINIITRVHGNNGSRILISSNDSSFADEVNRQCCWIILWVRVKIGYPNNWMVKMLKIDEHMWSPYTPKFGRIWYSTSSLGSWNSHWYRWASPKTWDYQPMSHNIAYAGPYAMLARQQFWRTRQACI